MNKVYQLFLSLLLLGTLFQSCKSDVDLYADYKDITVVYGLLDYQKDTNFIKINKAFLGPGNALEIAQSFDSCNYPEKLSSRIIEYCAAFGNSYQKTRVFELDTITIHNKETGIFYAPDQLVYYTTGDFKANTDHHLYRYALEIDRPDTTLRGETNIVGGSSFSVIQTTFNFAYKPTSGTIRFYPCPFASIYDVEVLFNYIELSQNHDSVPHCMRWKIGTYELSNLILEHGQYNITYNTATFHQMLAQELGSDTLKIVDRLIEDAPITIKISAGGEDLYNFISMNGPSSSIAQNVPDYSNIAGGFGVFSSRTSISKKTRISPQSLIDLQGHENWRFRQM